jgi:hypothetical protein
MNAINLQLGYHYNFTFYGIDLKSDFPSEDFGGIFDAGLSSYLSPVSLIATELQ